MISFTFHESDSVQSPPVLSKGDEKNPYMSHGKLLRPQDTHKSVFSDVSNHVAKSTTTTRSSDKRVDYMNKNGYNNSIWMNRLLESLSDQELLTTNALSKFHLWEDVVIEPSLHENGRNKRVLFYMGEVLDTPELIYDLLLRHECIRLVCIL